MFGVLNAAIVQEMLSIKNSLYKLLLITLLPILSFTFLITIFGKGVATELPIVVVDKDKSEISRQLLFNIDASSTLKIAYRVQSTKEALTLVKASKAYALVIVPKNFKRDILLQMQPKVTAMLNTQYILIGKILKAALLESVLYSGAEVEYVKNLLHNQNTQESKSSLTPIALQITPFFNTYKNYFLFLIPAILPAILQIFVVIATIVSFGTLFKEGKEEEYFGNSYIKTKIIGKLLPYTLAYFILGVAYLLYIYGTLGWIFEGSLAITIFGMLLMIIAYQGLALLFFVSGFDYARSLSLGAVYTAPAFAFLGVTFPESSMNGFATFWREVLPISHYVQLQISQANYGGDIYLDINKLLVLAAFSLVYIPVFMRFSKRLSS